MRNHLCWDPGSVRRVINPFAEHITDGQFRAVHSDWDLKVCPPVGTAFQQISNRDWRDLSPREFSRISYATTDRMLLPRFLATLDRANPISFTGCVST